MILLTSHLTLRGGRIVATQAETSVHPQIGTMNISGFPLEILSMIAAHLSPADALKLGLTCKSLAELLNDVFLWKQIVSTTHDGLNFKDNRSWKQIAFTKLKPWCRHLLQISNAHLADIVDRSEAGSKCNDCKDYSGPDQWFCLSCLHVGCGRGVEKHAMEHCMPGHEMVLKPVSLDIWCYACNKWIGSESECDDVERARMGEITSFLQRIGAAGPFALYRRKREEERELTLIKHSQHWCLVDGDSHDRFHRFLIGNSPPPVRFNAPVLGPFVSYGRDFNILPSDSWPVILQRYPGSTCQDERNVARDTDEGIIIHAQLKALRNHLRRNR